MHISRYQMYESLSEYAPLAHGQALSISRSDVLCRILGYPPGSTLTTEYPAYDIRHLDLAADTFDCTAADQVLEHVAGNPAQAIAEMFRVTRPGGLVVATTCCVNAIHHGGDYDDYEDYWRFTPAGLRLLAQPHGDILEAAGWGNPLVCLWVAFRRHQVPPNPHHPIHRIATSNWPAWPLTVWVVARKSKETK
ncbi:MAG TPA: methyltransferase domain-containing protein [Anaerolineae bacterium]|nr:methyltransferase domain-containing protein [Anaerolineae bacterium]